MIKNGKQYTQQITVSGMDTAIVHGSGNLEVFATPALVALMENTAVHCLEGDLEEGTDTVGIEIHVQHMKATKVGGKITCKAIVSGIEGRKIHFEIDAWDEQGQIGHATHDRFIIQPRKFMDKLG